VLIQLYTSNIVGEGDIWVEVPVEREGWRKVTSLLGIKVEHLLCQRWGVLAKAFEQALSHMGMKVKIEPIPCTRNFVRFKMESKS